MGRESRIARFPSKPPSPIVNIAQARSKREPLEQNRKTSIFVAIPTVSGRVNHSIALLFARCMESNYVPECPFRFAVHIEPGTRGADYARNRIVKGFLEGSDHDWLVMIDDDQVVPDNFWMMCAVTDADIVSGLTPVWVGNMDPETMLRPNNYGVDADQRCYNLPMPADDVSQPYRVPIVGTGCVAIRRRVFAPKPYGVGDHPFYFTHADDRKIRGGEDINFSVECNRAGFILAVHPQVKFDHLKEIPLWQVEQYYRARKKMESEGRNATEEQRLSLG